MRMPPPPEDVQWLPTAACNLRCLHCGTDAGKPWLNELTTEEAMRMLDAATDGSPLSEGDMGGDGYGRGAGSL